MATKFDYYNNRKIKSQLEYDGKLLTYQKNFYQNGKIKSEHWFDNEQRTKEFWYNKDGIKICEFYFKDDDLLPQPDGTGMYLTDDWFCEIENIVEKTKTYSFNQNPNNPHLI